MARQLTFAFTRLKAMTRGTNLSGDTFESLFLSLLLTVVGNTETQQGNFLSTQLRRKAAQPVFSRRSQRLA